MRIGVLSLDWPPRGGGMSRFCFESCAELARRGHELTILTWHGARAVPGCPARVEPILRGDLSVDRRSMLTFDATVDVWHAWEFGYGALARFSRRPMIVTVHGNDLFRPQAYHRFTKMPLLHRWAGRFGRTAWQLRLGRRGFRRVARFLPNSARTGELLSETLDASDRIEIVPCGVGEHFFQQREPHAGVQRLLTVCGLFRARRRKNVESVIRALAGLRGEFDFQYDICGEGDMLDELRDLARDGRLEDRITIHGPVNDERLASLYRRADLFILTPIEMPDDVEGFGIVYLEANATGVPCLATCCGGIPDAVSEGISGYFAHSPDPADIASALRSFLAGHVIFNEPKVRAWAETHRYARVAERLERIYRDVMGTQGSVLG